MMAFIQLEAAVGSFRDAFKGYIGIFKRIDFSSSNGVDKMRSPESSLEAHLLRLESHSICFFSFLFLVASFSTLFTLLDLFMAELVNELESHGEDVM